MINRRSFFGMLAALIAAPKVLLSQKSKHIGWHGTFDKEFATPFLITKEMLDDDAYKQIHAANREVWFINDEDMVITKYTRITKYHTVRI